MNDIQKNIEKINSIKIEMETIKSKSVIQILQKEIDLLNAENKELEKNKNKINKSQLLQKIGSLKINLNKAFEKSDIKQYQEIEKEIKKLKTILNKLKGDIKFINIKQLNLVIKQIELHSSNQVRDKLLIMLGFELGMRANEVLDIQTKDINLDTGEIVCRRTKNSNQNRLKLSTDTLFLIKQLIKELDIKDINSSFLFFNSKKERLTYNGLNFIIKKFFDLANIPKELQHFHVLKHGRGVWLAEQQTPLQTIKFILGHKSIKNTLIYANYTPLESLNIIDKLNTIKVWRG